MRPPAPTWESICRRSWTSWPRPRIGSSASRSGSSTKIRSISSSIVAVRIASASVLGCSGAKAGSVASEPSVVCSSPVTTPSACRFARNASGSAPSASSARSQPSVAPARYSCRTPSVASMRLPSYCVPAGDRRDVREVALGQEAQQLELRVHARLDAPERLQDQRLAEHDRGVGLLDADRAHLDRPAFGGAPPDQRKPSVPSLACTSTLERIRCSSSRAWAGSASAS